MVAAQLPRGSRHGYGRSGDHYSCEDSRCVASNIEIGLKLDRPEFFLEDRISPRAPEQTRPRASGDRMWIRWFVGLRGSKHQRQDLAAERLRDVQPAL